MCWNAEVSLNTFLFSSFMLFLIIYNNLYTQYKIVEFKNLWVCLFFVSFILMQLIEFFIWKTINNKYYNNIFSIIATLLILLQPVASLMILSNIDLRNKLLIVYSLLVIPYSIYKFNNQNIHTIISSNKHLHWKFFNFSLIEKFIWLFFILFSLFYEGLWIALLFGIITLIVMLYFYHKDHTVGSMWCWIINSVFIILGCYLLFYLPFLENQ
jgi:uncharacterized membrane protein HdeD (DUF308 family)